MRWFVALIFVLLFCGAILAMDAITYGGLFKNATWQAVRRAIGNDWGPE